MFESFRGDDLSIKKQSIMIKTLNFVVDFHHTQDEKIIAGLNPPRVMPKAATICEIFEIVDTDSVKAVSKGKAFCTKNDQFVKATGRKVALRKAVASLPREQRVEIWSSYLAACKPVRK